MPRFENPLRNIKIASPCSANWNEMIGSERKRYCGECKLNVYNLSGMTRDQAETLIASSEGRICVRFFQRSDGSVITDDCPVGWRAAKKRVSRFCSAAASLIFAFLGGTAVSSLFAPEPSKEGQNYGSWLGKFNEDAEYGKPLMGAISSTDETRLEK